MKTYNVKLEFQLISDREVTVLRDALMREIGVGFMHGLDGAKGCELLIHRTMTKGSWHLTVEDVQGFKTEGDGSDAQTE